MKETGPARASKPRAVKSQVAKRNTARSRTAKSGVASSGISKPRAQNGTTVSAETPVKSCFFARRHMKRMAPASVQDEEMLPTSAIMCHIMLLNSVLERSANRAVEEQGLTFTQWMALGCIGHCGKEGIRHAELGNRLMLSKAPVTGVVDRLERGGYVHREADASDRRVSRVVITDDGEAAWMRVRQQLREHSVKLCSHYSEDEQMLLLGLLSRLLEHAAQSDPILSSRDDFDIQEN